jgi:putative CocE/NonD family hydrolase
MAQPQPRPVREIEHVWIPMYDGTRLSARIWLPAGPETAPVPAILEYIPYRKRDMVRARDERNHPVFVAAGYACLRVDMRGSGDSEGLMADMYGRHELDDVLAVIDWIAAQPWCDGSVGMMGTSWGGTASMQAAARRPEALKAILAVCATDNRFDDDIHHMGGCLLTDTVEWGATLPAILASPPDPETVGEAWRAMWMERLDNLAFPLEQWIAHETRDSYWRNGAVNEEPGAIACPILLVGGWFDRYSNTVMNLMARSHERCWGIIGPWSHHYPDVASPGPGIDFQGEAIRWWDRWLKGRDTGIDREPRLRVWMQSWDAPRDRIDLRSGQWAGFQSWADSHREFWLTESGLVEEKSGEGTVAGVPWSLSAGASAGDTGYFGRTGGQPGPQEDDGSSLIFESEPLIESLDLLGSPAITLKVESDQPVATLVVRLIDVPSKGAPARVSYGVANLAQTDRGTTVRSMKPGEPRALDLVLHNTAYRFEPGHRLRIAVSSSYWPMIWPSPRPVTLTLHLGETCLRLPLAPEQGCSGRPVSFAGPVLRDQSDSFVPQALPALERGTDEGVMWWNQPAIWIGLEKIALDFGFETNARHGVRGDDPLSASTRFEHRMYFRREGLEIEIRSFAQLAATSGHYRVEGHLTAYENGTRVFERSWNPEIPRTCS